MFEEKTFNSKEAIDYLLKMGYRNYKEIAREMSLDEDSFKIKGYQIEYYHTGKHVMSKKTAEEFNSIFGIVISDVYKPKGRPPIC